MISAGIKNELTTKRNNSNTLSMIEIAELNALNYIFFQDHLFITCIESQLVLLLVYRNGIFFSNQFEIYRLLYLVSKEHFYLYYLLFISKHFYTLYSFTFISFIIKSTNYIFDLSKLRFNEIE